MTPTPTPYTLLRTTSLLEGTSFLLLVFVAMPLKYLADTPQPVSVVGMAHGLLFLALLLVIAYAWARGLPTRLAALAAVAAVLPFGPFVLDPKLKAAQAHARG